MDTIKNYLAENKIETSALDGITDTSEINRNLNEQHRNVYRSGGFVSPTVGVTVEDKDVNLPHAQYMEKLNSEVYSTVGPKAFDNVSGDYSKSRLEYISAQTPLATTVRRDSLNRPMIGYGMNLDLAENFALAAGVLNKTPAQMNDIYTGKTAITGSEGRALYEAQVEQADQLISAKTGDAPLRAQQRIVLTALAIHNPKLIGPGIIKSIKNGDVEGAINEIENRSNAAGSRELRMRRKRDAQHFANYTAQGDRGGNASLATMMGMTNNGSSGLALSKRPVKRPTSERGVAASLRPRLRPTSSERAEVAAQLDVELFESNPERPGYVPPKMGATELNTPAIRNSAGDAEVDRQVPAPLGVGQPDAAPDIESQADRFIRENGMEKELEAFYAKAINDPKDAVVRPKGRPVPRTIGPAEQLIIDGGMEASLEEFYAKNINDPKDAVVRPKGRPVVPEQGYIPPQMGATELNTPAIRNANGDVDAVVRPKGRPVVPEQGYIPPQIGATELNTPAIRNATGGIDVQSWAGYSSAIEGFIKEGGGDPEITVQFYDLESYEEARASGEIEAGSDVMIGDSPETAVVFPYLSDETEAADGAELPTLFSQAMEASRVRAEEAAAQQPVRLPGETPQAYMVRTGERYGANFGEAGPEPTKPSEFSEDNVDESAGLGERIINSVPGLKGFIDTLGEGSSVLNMLNSTPVKLLLSDVLVADGLKKFKPITEKYLARDELSYLQDLARELGVGAVGQNDYKDAVSVAVRKGDGPSVDDLFNMNPASRMKTSFSTAKITRNDETGDYFFEDQYDHNMYVDYTSSDETVISADDFEKSGISTLEGIISTLTADISPFKMAHNMAFLLGSRDFEDDSKDVGRKVRINLGPLDG
tara:strand:- start:972 stop:3605 length:2634 start_codon:yes stop_codon:yes gene_type:complete